VRPGDTVWDVGANVGLYTEQLAALTGRFGAVVAFEPTPACFEALAARCAGLGQVLPRQEALGATDGEVPMALADDHLGATHTLVGASAHQGDGGGGRVSVPLRRGDGLVARGEAPAPTVVKIDVEGFEGEVVEGLRETLARPACRAVFIEVHFALLARKGEPEAPAHLVRHLKDMGFRVRWLDASHLEARR
jgi:FkbM family methyltransferase